MFSILNGGRTMVKTSQNQPVKKKRNTRGMGSIRQKNGGYEGRITIKVNGKSKQISLFNKDKRILVQEMIKAKQEANDNEYVEKDKITLEEWLKKWIRIHKRPFVKPRTLQGYIEKIKTNIISYLGDYPMQSLDRLILQEYFSDLTTGNEKKGIKKYSPKTIKEIKIILNMAFTDAEIDKIIKFNPIPTIRTPKVKVSLKEIRIIARTTTVKPKPNNRPNGIPIMPSRKASMVTLAFFCLLVAPILASIPSCLIRSCREIERTLLIMAEQAAISNRITTATAAIIFTAPLPAVTP